MTEFIDRYCRAARHSGGTLERKALEGIAARARSIRILHSAETGCGTSTLLLSHFSEDHLVFTVDCEDGSYRAVKNSGMLRNNVTFVLGPSQVTLPRFEFCTTFQLVLLDGPHAHPFPDLEYYFFYPHIAPGGWLIVDDVQIRSIGRMIEILKADDMWELEDTICNTAFFRRTLAPVFSPTGDGWWEQGYNRQQDRVAACEGDRNCLDAEQNDLRRHFEAQAESLRRRDATLARVRQTRVYRALRSLGLWGWLEGPPE